MPKPALGRGLGALLGGATPAKGTSSDTSLVDQSASSSGERVQRIALSKIRPCPFQPRHEFTQESLQELSNSIAEQGILQPLIVRQQDDHYELIAGERRWRAAQMLELGEVPVLIRTADDQEVLELALIENLQRENLNALEEALGYAKLINQFKMRQEDVAIKVGKSRTAVANALRLLKLPRDVQDLVRIGKLSVGHAKVILSLATDEEQSLAAECVLKDGLNVRQTEELVALFQNQGSLASIKSSPPQSTSLGQTKSIVRDAHITDLENRLCEKFGTKVHLRYRKGKGTVQIRFFNDEDLERILQISGVEVD